MTIDAAMQKAVQHHGAGQLAEAERLYRLVLAQQASHPDALHLLGLVARRAGQLDDSLRLISRATELVPTAPHYHCNLGLVLMDLKRVEEAVAAFKTAIDLAPGFAQAHNNLGVAYRDLGRFADSATACRTAVQLQPDFAEAYCNLSNAQSNLGEVEEAIATAETAVRLQPGLLDAHYNLGTALNGVGRFEEAAGAFSHVLTVKPDHVKALNNLGNSLRNLRKIARAIDAYSAAIAADPYFADAHWNLALACLLAGDFERGWSEHEWRLKCDSLHRPQAFPQPRWDGEPLNGRTILLHPEQGLGDSIQFVRYAPMVVAAGGKVVLQCQEELQRLFMSIPGILQVISRGQPLPEFDVHSPLLSLPLVFSTRLDSIPSKVPYLSVSKENLDRWHNRVGDIDGFFKAGLVWSGGPNHKNDRNRSTTLVELLPLADLERVRFYSLQKGLPSSQVEELKSQWSIVNFTSELDDLVETAGLISQMDLVISVDTAVAHLAGAMGKPTWILLAADADWRWMLKRAGTPWYPTMKLFRQRQAGDWAAVVAEIKRELLMIVA